MYTTRGECSEYSFPPNHQCAVIMRAHTETHGKIHAKIQLMDPSAQLFTLHTSLSPSHLDYQFLILTKK